MDFVTTAQATSALINSYNHSLDGRSLIVEYASLDAARRGGYRPPAANGDAATTKSSGKASAGFKSKGHGKKSMGERENANGSAPSNAEAHEDIGPDVSDVQLSKKRKTGDDGERAAKKPKSRDPAERMANSKHRRSKPGAALAMAQREKVAIVPSTGTRLVFT